MPINTPRQFLFGDRAVWLTDQNLLQAPTDVIISPATTRLALLDGLAAQIREQGGDQIDHECERLVQEYGLIDSGMAVYTSAGNLPFKAIIHAVGPQADTEDGQRELEQAVSRSLQLCEMNEWQSVAVPAISIGLYNLSIEVNSRALYRAITRFWDARHECVLDKIILCLGETEFKRFLAAFREQGEEDNEAALNTRDTQETVGQVDLSEQDIAALDKGDIDDWFK